MAEKSVDEFGFLKNALELAFLIALYLYFSGWIYLYFYLNSFGLSIRQVDIDFYNLIIYSLNVFIYLFSRSATVIVLTILTILAITVLAIMIKSKPSLLFIIFLGLFPILYVTSAQVGIMDARKQLINKTSNLKNIEFVLKNSNDDNTLKNTTVKRSIIEATNKQERNDFLTNNMNENLRLIMADNEEYYVFLSDSVINESNVANFVPIVYSIKKENILFIKISK